MNSPFKSDIVCKLIMVLVFSFVVAMVLTMVNIYVNPSIVNEPMPLQRPVQIDPVIKLPVPEFQLNTNWNTNIYGSTTNH